MKMKTMTGMNNEGITMWYAIAHITKDGTYIGPALVLCPMWDDTGYVVDYSPLGLEEVDALLKKFPNAEEQLSTKYIYFLNQ